MLRCVASLRKMSSFSGQKLDLVVKQLESLAPISLAEKWDNVGLLIEPAREVRFYPIYVYKMIYIYIHDFRKLLRKYY